MSKRFGWYALGVVAIGMIGVGGFVNRDDDRDGESMTLLEAACGLLRDGQDPERVYQVMKDLADDHPLVFGEDETVAARAAVERAQAQGCG